MPNGNSTLKFIKISQQTNWSGVKFRNYTRRPPSANQVHRPKMYRRYWLRIRRYWKRRRPEWAAESSCRSGSARMFPTPYSTISFKQTKWHLWHSKTLHNFKNFNWIRCSPLFPRSNTRVPRRHPRDAWIMKFPLITTTTRSLKSQVAWSQVLQR